MAYATKKSMRWTEATPNQSKGADMLWSHDKFPSNSCRVTTPLYHAGICKRIPAFFFLLGQGVRACIKPQKLISLVLSFSILFMSVAPSYAEVITSGRNAVSVSGTEAEISRTVDNAVNTAANRVSRPGDQYEELKELVEQTKETFGNDGEGDAGLLRTAIITVDTKTGKKYAEVDLREIDVNNETDLQYAFDQVFGDFLHGEGEITLDDGTVLTGAKFVSGIEDKIRANYETQFNEKIFDAQFKAQTALEVGGYGLQEDAFQAAYEKIRKQAFEGYLLLTADEFEEYRQTAWANVREKMKQGLKQDLAKLQAEDAAQEKERLKQLINGVWDNLYAQRSDEDIREKLDFVAMEAMPLFRTAGLVDSTRNKQTAEYLHQVLKDDGQACIGEEYGPEKQAQCARGLKAIVPLGIFGKYQNKEDIGLISGLMASGYERLGGASAYQVGVPALLGLGGADALASALQSAAVPEKWRKSYLRQAFEWFDGFTKDGKGGIFNPFGMPLRVAAEDERNSLEWNSFARNMAPAFYETEDGSVGNIFYDIGKYLAEESARGNEVAKRAVEKVMRWNLQFEWSSTGNNSATYPSAFPQMPFKMFMVGAMAGGYKINISKKLAENDRRGHPNHVYQDEYGVKWKMEQIRKWNWAIDYMVENWACGAYQYRGQNFTWDAGISDQGFVLYGLLKKLKEDKMLTPKQHAWVKGELATLYNRELAQCDRHFAALSKAAQAVQAREHGHHHTYGQGVPVQSSSEDMAQYADLYAQGQASLEHAKHLDNWALVTDIVLIIISLWEIGVTLVRGGLALFRATGLAITAGRAANSAKHLSRLQALARGLRVQRLGRFGTESFGAVLKGKTAFRLSQVRLSLTPSVLRTVREAEVLEQMSRGYAQYLRTSGAVEGLSRTIPKTYLQQGWALAKAQLPYTIGDITGRMADRIQNRASARYAQANNLVELGAKTANRNAAQTTLLTWLKENNALIEYKGFYFVNKKVAVPPEISVLFMSPEEIAAQAAKAAQQTLQASQVGQVGPRGGTIGLDGKPVENISAPAWESLGKNETVVTGQQGFGFEPNTTLSNSFGNYYPQSWEIVHDGYTPEQFARAENLIAQTPAKQPFWTPERLGKWDKFTFGLTTKFVKQWRVPMHIRQGLSSLLTAGMLTLSSPTMATEAFYPKASIEWAYPTGAITRTPFMAEPILFDPLRVERGAFSAAPVFGRGNPTGANPYKLASQLAYQDAALPGQFNSFQHFLGLQQDMLWGSQAIRLSSLRTGHTPGMANFQAGLYPFTHPISAAQLAFSPLFLSGNPYYRSYQHSLTASAGSAATAAAATVAAGATTAAASAVAEDATPLTTSTAKQEINWWDLLFSDEILDNMIAAEKELFAATHPARSAAALGIRPRDPLLEKLQQTRQQAAQLKRSRKILKDIIEKTNEAFLEKYASVVQNNSVLDVLTEEETVLSYYDIAKQQIEQSRLDAEVKAIIFSKWDEVIKTHLQSIEFAKQLETLRNEGIPVYDVDKHLLTSWPLDDEARKLIATLKPNQRLYIIVKPNDMLADMYLREVADNPLDSKDTLIRSDIEVLSGAVLEPTRSAFGWKKVLEGIMLVNNRLAPLYGLYLMAGMGNVSSTIANFSKVDFSLTNGEMYLLGGISSVAMGLLSFVAGMVQTYLSHNPDGTINGRRGRNITMNIGMAGFLLGMLIPMLGGMYGQLGDPTDLKKVLLITSFFCLGIGAAFMDVATKPVVVSASMRDDYQTLHGYLSVFKQTVGNAGNYLIPPIAMAIASLFGDKVDWTIFFPIYGALGLGIAALYNFSTMHQSTLELSDGAEHGVAAAEETPAPVEEQESSLKDKMARVVDFAKKIVRWEELTGNQPYNTIIRHGVAAMALHGMNMGILGLYVNQLFQEHVGGKFDMYANAGQQNVFQAVWESLSNSWLGQSLLYFTIPIIIGRLIGTYLMKHEIKIGNVTIPKLNLGHLLLGSAALTVAGIGAIAFGSSWTVQLVGVVATAIGLTNISPVVGGYTSDQARHVSDAVSTLLSGTAIVSFFGNLLFGWFRDLTTDGMWDWLPLIMPVVALGYLGFFGWEIASDRFHTMEEPATTSFVLDPATDTENVSVQPEFLDNTESIPWAQDLERLFQDVPVNDMHRLFDGFRGMRNLSLPEIQHILQKGLEVDKTHFNAIYFATDLLGGHDPDQFAQLLADGNELDLMSKGTIPFLFSGNSGIPLLVTLKENVEGLENVGGNSQTIAVKKDIAPEHLEVFAFLHHEGTDGWYQLSLMKDGKLLATPLYKYLLTELGLLDQNASLGNAGETAPETAQPETATPTVSAEDMAFLGQKQTLKQQFKDWFTANENYIAEMTTRQAVLSIMEKIDKSSVEDVTIYQAIYDKLAAMQLGNPLPNTTVKLLFKPNQENLVTADNFYLLHEVSGIPSDWALSRLPNGLRTTLRDGKTITLLTLDDGATDLKVRNWIQGIRTKSGLKIRMGAHELGLTSTSYNKYKQGDLHIHFESEQPDANGIYYNYVLKINAGKLVRKKDIQALKAIYQKYFGFFLNEEEINWPTGAEEDSIFKKLGDLPSDPAAWLLAIGVLGAWALDEMFLGGNLDALGLASVFGLFPFLSQTNESSALAAPVAEETSAQADMPIVSRLSQVATAYNVFDGYPRLVWGLYDQSGKLVGYLKYASPAERARTEQFDQLMKQGNYQEKYPLLDIHYSKILSVGMKGLPKKIRQQIARQAEELSTSPEQLRQLSEILILSAENMSGVTLNDVAMYPDEWVSHFGGALPSWEQWQQVRAFFEDLHQQGFEHTDLMGNFAMSSGQMAGKITATMIDFDEVTPGSDEQNLDEWERELKDQGAFAAQKASAGSAALAATVSAANDTFEWNKVARVRLISPNHLVWELYDETSHLLGYFKLGNQAEIDKTRQFESLMKEHKLQEKFDRLQIEYSRVLGVGLEKLSEAVQKEILENVAQAQSTGAVRDFDNRSTVGFVLSAAGTGGVTFAESNPDKLADALQGYPIIRPEWNQIKGFFDELHKLGFQHTDLPGNTYFRRLNDDRIKLTLIDFENVSTGSDEMALMFLKENLEHANMLVQRDTYFVDWGGTEEKSFWDKTSDFIYRHSDELFSALLLGMFGLGHLFNIGADDSLLFVSFLPFLLKPATTDGEIDLSTVTKATMRDQYHLVWQLVNGFWGKKIAFGKYGSAIELARTKQFGEIVQRPGFLEKYPLLKIVFPVVVAEGVESLPEDIQRKIQMGKNGAAAFGQVRDMEGRSEVFFVLSPIDIAGLTYRQYTNQNAALMAAALQDKPITEDEWKQIEAFIRDLHEAGFEHTDLLNNLYIGRDKDGKLQLSLLDFELVADATDSLVLALWKKRLYKKGLLILDESKLSHDEMEWLLSF